LVAARFHEEQEDGIRRLTALVFFNESGDVYNIYIARFDQNGSEGFSYNNYN